MSHSYHGHHSHEFEVIQPVIQPAQHCVSGQQIDNRQARQKRRIRKGIRQGKLVGWEITRLKQQQRRIRKAERRMRNSGHCLTRHEVNKLMHKLDRAGNKIRNLKRNNVRRGYGHHHHRNHR
ncbi:MAG: hypothetical protein ACPG51_13400 [Thiolinea sp.]